MVFDRDLERHVQTDKQPEKRKSPKPAAQVEDRNGVGVAQGGIEPDEGASDAKPAQNKEQFVAVESAMPEKSEPSWHLGIEQNESMGEYVPQKWPSLEGSRDRRRATGRPLSSDRPKGRVAQPGGLLADGGDLHANTGPR